MLTSASKFGRRALTSPYFLIVPLSWIVLMVYYSPKFGFSYSRDSYGYYLIGKNLFSGEGYTSPVLRDFYLTHFDNFFPSRSFPPLWPILIGLLDKIIHNGIASGLVINLAVTYGVLFSWFKFSLRFDKAVFILFGSLLFFLFVNEPFSAEILSGRSVPVVLLCLIVLLNVLSSDNLSKSHYFIAGALLGLISLTRTDCLLFTLGAPLVILLRKDAHLRAVVTIYAGMFLTLLPWLIRNIWVFGTPLASDNALTAMSTYPAVIPINYFEGAPPLLTEDYKLWAAQRIQYLLVNIKNLNAMLAPLGGWIIIACSLIGFFISISNAKINFKESCLYGLTWLWVIANLASVSMTPFPDLRYFSISAFLIMTSGTLTIFNAVSRYSGSNVPLNETEHKKKKAWLIHSLIGLIAFIFIVISYSKELNRNGSDHYKGLQQAFGTIIKPTDLVGSPDADTQTYYTGWKTIYLPLNLPSADENFMAWAKKWKVRYIIVEQSSPLVTAPDFIQKGTFGSYVLLDIAGISPIVDVTDHSSTKRIANTTYKLTDHNWLNGVARNWAGFFISYTAQDQNNLKPGKKIKFADSSIRTIVKREIAGAYLHITVDGKPLDGAVVGYPNEFEIQE